MPPLLSIAVAVDGSASSERALATAIELAKLSSGSLCIVAVVPVHRFYRSPTQPVEQTNPEDQRFLFARLREYAGRSRRAGVKSVSTRILEGSVVDELLRFVDEVEPDLFVLGARGLSATRRLLLGSVSDAVVHHAKSSVLIVRSPDRPPSGTEAARTQKGSK